METFNSGFRLRSCHDLATIKQRSFMLFYCKSECNILNQHRVLPYSLSFASHLKSIRKNIGLHPSWQLENKQVKMDTLRVCINKGTIILGMKKRHAEQLSVFKWIVLWCKLVHSALMKWILFNCLSHFWLSLNHRNPMKRIYNWRWWIKQGDE